MTRVSLDFEVKGRTVVFGIGSESRGDDAAGVRIIDCLRGEIESSDVLLINGGTVPENFTSKVKKFEPDTILILDSVEFGGEPGEVSVVAPSEILEDSVSTHRIPLSRLMDYLELETGARVVLLGIQPKAVEIGTGMSDEVRSSVDELASILKEKIVNRVK